MSRKNIFVVAMLIIYTGGLYVFYWLARCAFLLCNEKFIGKKTPAILLIVLWSVDVVGVFSLFSSKPSNIFEARQQIVVGFYLMIVPVLYSYWYLFTASRQIALSISKIASDMGKLGICSVGLATWLALAGASPIYLQICINRLLAKNEE